MDDLDRQIQAVEARIARLRLLPHGNYSTSSSEEEEDEEPAAKPRLPQGNYSTSSCGALQINQLWCAAA